MRFLYFISKLLTLPGAYLKGFWEHVVCKILRIPVENTKYFQMNESCGHVEHFFAQTKPRIFLICWLPGVLNGLFGTAMLLTGTLNLFYLGVTPTDIFSDGKLPFYVLYIIFLYLGLSIYCNLFPLVEDALYMWHKLYQEKGVHILVRILLFIPSIIIVAGAYLERYGLTVLLAIGGSVAGFLLK